MFHLLVDTNVCIYADKDRGLLTGPCCREVLLHLEKKGSPTYLTIIRALRGNEVQFVSFMTVNPIYQHCSVHLLLMKKGASCE